MNAVSVLVLLLVCVFTAAEDSLNIICEDVTGHVGVELPLTCRVSFQSDTCSMKLYKFVNVDKDKTICKKTFESDPCQQSISCLYTANEVMTTKIKFFIQTPGEAKAADFTVNITEDTARVAKIVETTAAKPGSPEETQKGNTALAMTSISICLVIMVLVGVILRRKYNCTNNPNGVGDREENNISEPLKTEV